MVKVFFQNPYLILASLVLDILVVCVLVWAYYRRRTFVARRPTNKTAIAFFHPYCNDGGGGERVLWSMIDALIQHDAHHRLQIVIYSGDNATPQLILAKAKNQFGIALDAERVDFVFLKKRYLVEASRYPRFTMLGQSVGSMRLAWEALSLFTPHIFIDTMGYSFSFPIFKFFAGATVGCYVHYPTISTDMLEAVSSGNAAFNNNQAVASSSLKTKAKLWYYKFFAFLYNIMGKQADMVIVNSSWTGEHIRSLWKRSDVKCLFPPCDTSSLQFPIKKDSRLPLVVSLGQYRPEKNHALQLQAFELFRKAHTSSPVKLVTIGSIREGNEGDAKIVDDLRAEVARNPILQGHVEVKVNISRADKNDYLSKAAAGLHTMSHEHFGIGVVEFMAAGVIPVAHNSGGPKVDIVVPYQGEATGFLATTAQQYADSLAKIFADESEATKIRSNARKAVTVQFSDESFQEKFVQVLTESIPEVKTALASTRRPGH